MKTIKIIGIGIYLCLLQSCGPDFDGTESEFIFRNESEFKIDIADIGIILPGENLHYTRFYSGNFIDSNDYQHPLDGRNPLVLNDSLCRRFNQTSFTEGEGPLGISNYTVEKIDDQHFKFTYIFNNEVFDEVVDCGNSYYMKNSTDEDIRLCWWYSGSDIIERFNIIEEFIVIEEVTIPARKRVLLYESIILGSKPSALRQLSQVPFLTSYQTYPYDSVRFESASRTMAYIKDDCLLSDNPLCEKNYKLIRSVDTKKEKIEEWEFTIK